MQIADYVVWNKFATVDEILEFLLGIVIFIVMWWLVDMESVRYRQERLDMDNKIVTNVEHNPNFDGNVLPLRY